MFKIAFYKIKHLFCFNKNIHFQNLKNNTKVLINGKTYVKVNLRFVDTLDINSTKLIQNLEEELESLRLQIQKQIEIIAEITNRNDLLHNLNLNLIYENKQIEKYLKLKKEKYNKINIDFQKQLNKLTQMLESRTTELIELNQMLKIKNNEINEFIEKEQQFKEIKSINDGSYKKSIKELENKIIDLKQSIKQKSDLLETITNKIFEKERKIRELQQINLNLNTKLRSNI